MYQGNRSIRTSGDCNDVIKGELVLGDVDKGLQGVLGGLVVPLDRLLLLQTVTTERGGGDTQRFGRECLVYI